MVVESHSELGGFITFLFFLVFSSVSAQFGQCPVSWIVGSVPVLMFPAYFLISDLVAGVSVIGSLQTNLLATSPSVIKAVPLSTICSPGPKTRRDWSSFDG